MRDNVKSGALTEVTFYILLSSIHLNTDMLSCSSLKKKQVGGFHWGRALLYGALNSMQEKGWIELFGDSEGRKKSILSL